MTASEVSKLIYVIKASYPRQYAGFGPSDYTNMVAAWKAVLEDYSYEEASVGLKVYLANDTKGFPPVPGQIIDCIHKMKGPANEDLIESEAWDLVYKTMTSMSWDRVEETFNRLPESCRRAIGSPARLREMASEEDPAAQLSDRTRFMDNYKATKQRMRDEAKIPERLKLEMKNAVERITGRKEGAREIESHNENPAG